MTIPVFGGIGSILDQQGTLTLGTGRLRITPGESSLNPTAPQSDQHCQRIAISKADVPLDSSSLDLPCRAFLFIVDCFARVISSNRVENRCAAIFLPAKPSVHVL